MHPLLQQIKKQRANLDLTQNDMRERIGLSRQQYQRLETKGNPRLNTLDLVAKGLNSELMLIPKEHLMAVKKILTSNKEMTDEEQEIQSLIDNPWRGLLGDDDS